MIYLALILLILLLATIYNLLSYLKKFKMLESAVISFNKEKKLYTPIRIEKPKFFKNFSFLINKNLLELQAYRAFQLNQLLDERNKFEVLLELMQDGIILLDDQKKIITYNQKFLRMFDIKEIPKDNYFFSAIPNTLINSFELFFTSGKDEINYTNRIFKLYFKNYKMPSIAKTGIAITARDITNEKELEKTKDDFFQMITHDLRSPLLIISGYCELIRKKLPTIPEFENKFNLIFSSVYKLNGMIDDILNFNKLKKNELSLKLSEVNPYLLLDKVVKDNTANAEIKNISIKNLTPIYLT